VPELEGNLEHLTRIDLDFLTKIDYPTAIIAVWVTPSGIGYKPTLCEQGYGQ
jgi:hypothetical protein